MSKLVEGDDGLMVEDVGEWVSDKHALLCDYIQISTYARKKYLPPAGLGGSTFIDLFCGPGRAKRRDTGEFVDGGCVAAWRKSVSSGAPFSKMIIGDIDEERLALAKTRLERIGAPVVALLGPATETAGQAVKECPVGALNFAFLDPYSLALDFSIISTLAQLYRIDIMVHVSQMDLQRNFDRNSLKDRSALDAFAPGWRDEVDTSSTQRTGRQAYFEYWKRLVSSTGVKTNAEIRLVTGPGNIPLYLLLLATRHDLAHKFWGIVAKKDDGQTSLF